MMDSPLVGPLLQGFFADHLLNHKHVSPQTVSSYRDTFRLFLNHLQETAGAAPAKLRLSQMHADAILSFLDSLEQKRHNCARSRNASEIATLRRSQCHFGASSFLQLSGKGRKERTVPLWPKTARVLQNWFKEIHDLPGGIAFPNSRGAELSRHGVTYILDRAFQRAAVNGSSLTGKSVSPHVIRHTTAMHLLQSGIDTSVIALWLGHESIETTHMYIEADLATKERALEKLAPPNSRNGRFRADDALLRFLASL